MLWPGLLALLMTLARTLERGDTGREDRSVSRIDSDQLLVSAGRPPCSRHRSQAKACKFGPVRRPLTWQLSHREV